MVDVRCVEIEVIAWPAEQDRRARLTAAGRPRLLLVDAGLAPPPADDCFEDWIYVPAGEDEVRARLEAIRQRIGHHGPNPPRLDEPRLDEPRLDEHGALHEGDHWVQLPPIEAKLAAVLLHRFGAVAGPSALLRAGWPSGGASRNTLDVRIHRLRRRLEPLGLTLRTVRGRGWLLERCAKGHRQPVA